MHFGEPPFSKSLVEGDKDSYLAFEISGVGAWCWDKASNLICLSARARELIRVSEPSLSFFDFLQIIHEDDRAFIDQNFHENFAQGHDFDVDFRTLPIGGKSVWIRMRGGSITGCHEVRGIFIDIVRRKAGEEANSRLAAIVTSSEDAIIGKSLDGIVTDWNRGAESIFGYGADEILGKSISLLLPLGREAEETAILDRVKRGERVEHFETQRRRKNGDIIDVSVTVSPVWDQSGRLLGASKVARDITLTKRAQTALAEREAHLQSVLDTVTDAMVIIDPHGVMQFFSATAERLFGYTADEAIGQNVSILMPGATRERRGQYPPAGEMHIIGMDRILAGSRKDGSVFPIELSVGEMKSGDKHFFTVFVRDLTERQQTQKRLQELQSELIHISRFSALGEMASTLAHELNQPLTAAASYLNGARRLIEGGDKESIPTVRDAVDYAAAQVLRAGQIIRRLREFVARGENEKQLENLPKLIEEASALALVGAKESGVRVSFESDPRITFVLADKIQIQQVLLNLMRNAIEAMQESSCRELKISTHLVEEDTVRVDVADSGPGISDDIARQLFQPFVTTKREGMGVGLSISRTIIEAHGGRIWAEGNADGGTTFRLTLKKIGAEDLDDDK